MYSTRLYATAKHDIPTTQPIAPYATLRALQRVQKRTLAQQDRGKKRDAAVLLAFLVAAFVICALVVNPAPDAIADSQQTCGSLVAYQVIEGDTLWSIATQYPKEGLSTKDSVHWLMESNGLTSAKLIVGQTILVPARCA